MKSTSLLFAASALLAVAYLGACAGSDARQGAGSGDRSASAAAGRGAGSTTAEANGRAGQAPGDRSAAPGAASPSGVAPAGAVGNRMPEVIRGIYLNAYAAGGRKRLHELLAIADRTEINSFVVDVKDERGPHYDTQVALAKQLTQPGQNTLHDLKVFTDTLHAHKLYAIARIVVFKDPVLSKAKPDWSIRRPGGGLWTDKKGNTWVSAWDRDVWNYNIQIAEEAARAGFDEIQFDYVRFPEPFPSLPPQVHPEARGDRTDAIVGFLTEAKQRLHPLGVPVAADVFGLSPADGDDIDIGQQWERLVTVADHVLPMVYPSHFLPSHLPADPRPNRAPGATVFKALGLGEIRLERLRQAGVTHVARVIPWLQAFSAPWVDHNFEYGPAQASDEIQAVYRTGIDDWIFWHPGAKYELVDAAFAPTAQRHAQKFVPTPELLTYANVLDGRGARAARAQVAKAASSTR